MTELSVNHATFVIERSYPAAPARVFAAWASADAKAIWMDDPDFKSDGTESELDFRVGGHERFGGLAPDGTPYRYDARKAPPGCWTILPSTSPRRPASNALLTDRCSLADWRGAGTLGHP